MNEQQTDKRRFRRRAEARPDDILDAALELFITHGFAATRVEDIALRAGLSKGAVYLYFDSKQKIIEGLVRRSIVPIADQVSAQATEMPGDPRIVIRFIISMFAGLMSNPQIAAVPRIVLAEAGNFPELADMYRTEVLEKGISAVTLLIQRGIDQGIFRPVDPELTLRSIVGPMLMHFLLAPVFGITTSHADPDRAFVENHLDILFNGLSVEREGT